MEINANLVKKVLITVTKNVKSVILIVQTVKIMLLIAQSALKILIFLTIVAYIVTMDIILKMEYARNAMKIV